MSAARDTYDYIVVGGGSAGSVVASRLSEDPDARVLVLEAGGRNVPGNVNVPASWYTLLGTDIDWAYKSVPQPGLNGRQVNEPRGKLPGGSSNLYIMMHIRGHPADYDNWAYNGCPGWGYGDVMPFFQRLEDQEDDTSPWAGKGGPMAVTNAKLHDPLPVSARFIDACKELGYPETDDFNGPQMEGAGWHHLNVKGGKRHSASVAYLYPMLDRPNLTLETDAQTTRLTFNGTTCTGVEYVQEGERRVAHAAQEVIVCAGAMESPKLLMHSGIGNPEHLKAFGIDTRVALPGVGENFHNHVLVVCVTLLPEGKTLPDSKQNNSESALFTKSAPGWVGPDMQYAFVRVPQAGPNAIGIIPGVVRPMSRGWIRLASGDPLDKPLVNPNYFGAPIDADRLVAGVKLTRELFSTRALSDWTTEPIIGPISQTALMRGSSDADIRSFVVQNADSYHHQAGSCKMGSDEMSVVDPEGRVYGVERLRIADASVMPTVPSGNCQTGILMIAERISELIKKGRSAELSSEPAARHADRQPVTL